MRKLIILEYFGNNYFKILHEKFKADLVKIPKFNEIAVIASDEKDILFNYDLECLFLSRSPSSHVEPVPLFEVIKNHFKEKEPICIYYEDKRFFSIGSKRAFGDYETFCKVSREYYENHISNFVRSVASLREKSLLELLQFLQTFCCGVNFSLWSYNSHTKTFCCSCRGDSQTNRFCKLLSGNDEKENTLTHFLHSNKRHMNAPWYSCAQAAEGTLNRWRIEYTNEIIPSPAEILEDGENINILSLYHCHERITIPGYIFENVYWLASEIIIRPFTSIMSKYYKLIAGFREHNSDTDNYKKLPQIIDKAKIVLRWESIVLFEKNNTHNILVKNTEYWMI